VLGYIGRCPDCRPRDIALWAGAYGPWDVADPRQRRLRCLAAGSFCGLMVKAGLVRREEKPTRLWVTEKGLSALAEAERRRCPPQPAAGLAASAASGHH
jgi:hypothetical protein